MEDLNSKKGTNLNFLITENHYEFLKQGEKLDFYL
jgi:hypothetical protein